MDEKDGSILMESFPALVCIMKCGFYKRLDGDSIED